MAPEPADETSLAERLARIGGYEVGRGITSAGGDLHRLVRFLRPFTAKYRDGDRALVDAIDRRDFPAIRAAAHSIRGACAVVGAAAASDLAQRIEGTAALPGDFETLKGDGLRLHEELQVLSQAIAGELGP